MYDKAFKNLNHVTGENRIFSNGTQISPGYSPDLTIADTQNQITYILENERKSDRKAFLGDIMKAAYYCDVNNIRATLVIIMKETSNQTTKEQISNHLKKYFKWLNNLGASNLQNVLVLTDEEYDTSLLSGEVIGSPEFLDRCIQLLNEPSTN